MITSTRQADAAGSFESLRHIARNNMQNPEEVDNDVAERPTRNIFLRILFGGLWFVALYIISCFLIGFISALFASTSQYKSEVEAGAAGSQAGDDFTNKYGLIALLSFVLLFFILCFFRLLPGVGKYKKSKPKDA